MTGRLLRYALAMTTFAILGVDRAEADPITFYFTGESGSQNFQGSFTYNTSTPSVYGNSTTPNNLYYASTTDPISATFTYEGYSYSGSGATSDTYIQVEGTTSGMSKFSLYVQGAGGSFFDVTLENSSSSAPFQTSTALPTALNLADFPTEANVAFSAGDSVHYLNSNPISVLSTNPAVIPEPSSIVALGTGLALLAPATRRLRRRGRPAR